MRDETCPIQKAIDKMRNPDKIFRGKTIAFVFDSLPPRENWSHSLLDNSTKIFLSNLVSFSAKRGADMQVINDKQTIINLVTLSAWGKYQCEGSSFKEVGEEDLILRADLVVGLGLSQKSRETLEDSKIPCIIIRTSNEEVFPSQAVIIDETPDYAVGEVIQKAKALLTT